MNNSDETEQGQSRLPICASHPPVATLRRARLGESRANPGGVSVTGFAVTSAQASLRGILKISLNCGHREVSLSLGVKPLPPDRHSEENTYASVLSSPNCFLFQLF